jgi:uncharacterized protein GlcG (DUF336 family)
MSQKFIMAGACLFSLAVAAPASAQGVLTQHDVSQDMGMKILAGAIAECKKTNSSIAVAVVDRSGKLRAFLSGDKSQPHNMELAQRKAFTALDFKRPSIEWAERTGRPGAENSAQRMLDKVIPARGGMPIQMGDETIGGVGVSGSSGGGEGDENCAKAGIAAVAELLK